jgi:hypothetical protein
MTTHLHLVPRSRILGAILPLHNYIFVAWCSVRTHCKNVCSETINLETSKIIVNGSVSLIPKLFTMTTGE